MAIPLLNDIYSPYSVWLKSRPKFILNGYKFKSKRISAWEFYLKWQLSEINFLTFLWSLLMHIMKIDTKLSIVSHSPFHLPVHIQWFKHLHLTFYNDIYCHLLCWFSIILECTYFFDPNIVTLFSLLSLLNSFFCFYFLNYLDPQDIRILCLKWWCCECLHAFRSFLNKCV